MCTYIGCGGNDHVFVPFTLPRLASPWLVFFLQYSIPTSYLPEKNMRRAKKKKKIHSKRQSNNVYPLLIPSTYIHFLFLLFILSWSLISSCFVCSQEVFLCFAFSYIYTFIRNGWNEGWYSMCCIYFFSSSNSSSLCRCCCWNSFLCALCTIPWYYIWLCM